VDADHYQSLADDYHWFFDDVDLFLGGDTSRVRAAMAGLASGARVIDAACGNVVTSAWADLPDNFEAQSFDGVFCIVNRDIPGDDRYAAIARRPTGHHVGSDV
jgi:hypothetical protein